MAFKAGQKLKVIDLNGFSKLGSLEVGAIVTAKSDEVEGFIDIILPSGNPVHSIFSKRFEAVLETPKLDHPATVYFVEDETGDTFLTDDLYEIDEGNKVAVFTFSRLGTMKRPPVPAPVIS